MSCRIILTSKNLQELFRVKEVIIKRWTRLGILPCIEGRSPIRYNKKEIDAWVESGQLDKHRPQEYHHLKGVY